MTPLLAQAIRRLEALPEREQDRQADTIIVTLDISYPSGVGAQYVPMPLSDDPAIGMWQGREDLVDSSTAVRALRESEWDRRRSA